MPSTDIPQERPGLRRIAWILVITMSLLLVLAFVGLIFGFMRQSQKLMAGSAPAPVVSPVQGLASVTLAPGVRIVSAQADGGRLVLHLSGPKGDEVQVLDMATGALTQQVRTAP